MARLAGSCGFRASAGTAWTPRELVGDGGFQTGPTLAAFPDLAPEQVQLSGRHEPGSRRTRKRRARYRTGIEGRISHLKRGRTVARRAISGWREEFLAAGREGLKSRPRLEEDRRLVEAQRKIGELSMDIDILRALSEEVDRPLGRRGAKRHRTAGALVGPGLPGRGGLQVGGV